MVPNVFGQDSSSQNIVVKTDWVDKLFNYGTPTVILGVIIYAIWYTYREMIPLWKKKLEKDIELVDKTINNVVVNTQALERIKEHLEVTEEHTREISKKLEPIENMDGKIDVIGYDIKEIKKGN